jgi:ribosomal protein L40E
VTDIDHVHIALDESRSFCQCGRCQCKNPLDARYCRWCGRRFDFNADLGVVPQPSPTAFPRTQASALA